MLRIPLQIHGAALLAAAIDAGDSCALTLTGYHALEPSTAWYPTSDQQRNHMVLGFEANGQKSGSISDDTD